MIRVVPPLPPISNNRGMMIMSNGTNAPTAVWSTYQVTATKRLPSGRATLQGNEADTLEAAMERFTEAKAQYMATGGWGGAP